MFYSGKLFSCTLCVCVRLNISNELIYLAEDISRQYSIQALSRVKLHKVEWKGMKVSFLVRKAAWTHDKLRVDTVTVFVKDIGPP